MAYEEDAANELSKALLKVANLPRPKVRREILENAKKWIESFLEVK
jgi:hypothetical protein